MVKEITEKGRKLYVCEACSLAYEQRVWAEKCQAWCERHQSCNLEITEHAVPVELADNAESESGGVTWP